MVEEKVYVEVRVADLRVDLAADEGKPLTEFEQELLDMVNQLSFQFGFPSYICGAQEIKDIGVLEYLFRPCLNQWAEGRPGNY